MKKIFTLFFALFMMAFCAKAQYLLQEGFEDVEDGVGVLPADWIVIDGDNDGNNWYVLNNSQSSSGGFVVHSGEGHATSASWASAVLTPDNWLISPAVELTANATLTFWVAGQDPSYAAENYSVYISTTVTDNPSITDFTTQLMTGTSTATMTQQSVDLASYTGQTVRIAFRHHNVSDMFRLNLDDVEIFAQPTSPTIVANPTTIDFGTVTIPGEETATVTVTAYSLTAGITATTAAPFEVSADGTTYGTSATIAQAGGTLYVKYTPTTEGTNNGTVTLTSTGATAVTISLTGNSLDCTNGITSFPFTHDFNDGVVPPLCWGYNNAENFASLELDDDDYLIAIGAVDYLITPQIQSTTALNMSVDYQTLAGINDISSSSSFRVGYSTTNNNYNSFTWLDEITANQTADDLFNYTTLFPAGTKYIAIEATEIGIFTYGYSSYYNYLLFDNFTLSEINNPEISTGGVNNIDFGTIHLNHDATETVSVVGALLTSDITATTTAPFEVSTDNNTFGATATIPTTGGTLYVKYAPTAAGTNNGTVTLASTGATTVTITLNGSAIDCSNITLPLTESFEGTDCPANCWTIVYGDNNPDVNTMTHTDEVASVGTQSFSFSSYASSSDYTQYLITPELPVADKVVTFDYMTDYGTEKFHVGYSTSSDVTSFTWGEEISASNSDEWLTYTTVIPASATYIAIKYVSNYQYYLYIDNFQVQEATNPILQVTPNSMSFSYILGDPNEIQTANIVGSLLSDDIDISVTGPFEVSTDSITFGATATIAQAAGSGTLYVKFVPTTAGNHTGIITVSSTGADSDTIALNGIAISCETITTFPYTEDFENNSLTLDCWSIIDANNDGRTFSFYNGTARCQYHSTNDADDWLISPAIMLNGSQIATFDYWAASSSFPESFQVFAINDNGNTALTGEVSVTSNTAESQIVDLSSLNGTYKIGIHCISDADMYYLYIDNFVITDVSEPSLAVDPTSMTFSTIAGSASSVQTANVSGLALTDAITVSAPASFEVSADNTTFGASATIAASSSISTQAPLYVRYNPASAGSHNGTITLTSGTATASIAVTGTAADCSGAQSLPFTEDFETGEIPECWLNIDADGDGISWEGSANPVSYYSSVDLSGSGHNGSNGFVLSGSYSNASGEALTPDNWLITPALTIPSNGAMLSWWVAPQDADYAADHYQVMISTSGTATTDFTSVYEETISGEDWVERTVALPTYANQTIHIAFVHNNCTDMFIMKIDDISVTELSSDPTLTVDPTSINFGTITYPGSANATANVTAYNLTADITVTTTAPFAVSTTGSNYSTSATMTQPGGTLYIQYNPTAGGSHNGTVTLTSGSTTATITLTGSAIDCSTPVALPFVEDFENELNDCWSMIDNDGDGYNWTYLSGNENLVTHSGTGHMTSASWASAALTPDNWLITPAINLSQDATLSFWVAGQDPSYAEEHFSVYLSTTGNTVNDFTVTLLSDQVTTSEMTEYTANLSAYTGNNVYIAFRHHNVSDMFRINLDDVSVTPGVGIKEVENNVSIFPNPAHSYINVNATSNISNVEVYTIAGQKVADFTANGTTTVINTSNLSNGLYMMRINTENGTINKKFSVVR